MLELAAFGLFGAISIATAVMVIAAKEIMHSVFYLAAFFISIACIYIMLQTPFLFATQILIYVGGVVVMMIFAIMLVKREKEK
ncbi:MAG: hypothetical protein A7315_11600 [Candidatus Altiarchaeales archaeon WOR_SM1_79]|nr:MAG: hypothetical protein A7315_11600 [Candidatus Altiarchaeales archaeon WOR_SM1_79]